LNANQSEGSTSEKDDVSGTITVPEIAHDTEENEYVVCFLVPMGALGDLN
jgi:Activator of Hsp90 ATPase, N-terminal